MVKRNVDFSCLKNTSAMIIGVYSCYLANIFRSRVHHNDSFYICCFPMSHSSSTLIGRKFVENTIFFLLKQYFFNILYMIFLLMKCLQFQVQIYKTRLTTLFRWAFFLALLIEKISCTNHSKSSLVLADVDVTQCSKIRKSCANHVCTRGCTIFITSVNSKHLLEFSFEKKSILLHFFCGFQSTFEF